MRSPRWSNKGILAHAIGLTSLLSLLFRRLSVQLSTASRGKALVKTPVATSASQSGVAEILSNLSNNPIRVRVRIRVRFRVRIRVSNLA